MYLSAGFLLCGLLPVIAILKLLPQNLKYAPEIQGVGTTRGLIPELEMGLDEGFVLEHFYASVGIIL